MRLYPRADATSSGSTRQLSFVLRRVYSTTRSLAYTAPDPLLQVALGQVLFPVRIAFHFLTHSPLALNFLYFIGLSLLCFLSLSVSLSLPASLSREKQVFSPESTHHVSHPPFYFADLDSPE